MHGGRKSEREFLLNHSNLLVHGQICFHCFTNRGKWPIWIIRFLEMDFTSDSALKRLLSLQLFPCQSSGSFSHAGASGRHVEMRIYQWIRGLIKHCYKLEVPVNFKTGILLWNWFSAEQSPAEKCNFRVINKWNQDIKYKLKMRVGNVLAHQAQTFLSLLSSLATETE